MDDPELGSDEKVLARAQMVRVKSIVIEAVLTSRRIILADKIKGLLPRKEIPLTTIKIVKPGENAIREQVITFTILTNTGRYPGIWSSPSHAKAEETERRNGTNGSG